MSIGIPIKLLHEAEGHVVTLETVTGEVYRYVLLVHAVFPGLPIPLSVEEEAPGYHPGKV